MSRGSHKKVRLNPYRLIITILVIIMLVIVGIRAKKIVDLHLEKKALQAQNQALEDEKNSLKNELKNVNDLDYIEEQARRQLKMIRPGEMLYIIDEDKYDMESKKNNDDSEETEEIQESQ